MSELLGWVTNWSRLEQAHRIDPHALCKASHGGEEFWFLVSDDGWHGWFVAQHQGILEPRQLDEAAYLIRRIGQRRWAAFRFDWRDDAGLVRGVVQLPIANEPRWEEDVPAAIYTLVEEWGTLLPFLRRIVAGEAAEGMIDEAKKAFADIDAQHPQMTSPAILTRPDPWERR